MTEHEHPATRPAANLLVAAEVLIAGEVILTGDNFHHLVRVRRLKSGEGVQLTDGRGRFARGELVVVGRREARVSVDEPIVVPPPAVEVELLVAPPKPERAAWMVEKATELGVTRIRFLLTRRTTNRSGAAGTERLRRVATSALEQSFGLWLPDLVDPAGLEGVLLDLGPGPRFLLDPSGARPAAGAPPATVTLAVGPEGGFDDAERSLLTNAGFSPLSLGPQILRVETAAIVGVAVLGLGFGGSG